jgi:hypothetical protein
MGAGKGVPKRPRIIGPQNARDRLFCERWLIHFDKDRAWREAGFAVNAATSTESRSKIDKFAEYLRPIREAKAKIMAERLAITSEQIVDGMTKRVFFDPVSFFERSSEPLTEMVKPSKRSKTLVERVVTWDGKPVYRERLKPYSDLTPEQQAIVEITSEAGQQLKYRLPNIREQHMYLTSLGRQFGMFAEKLIIERHRHSHVHGHLTFDNVPSAKLSALTHQLLPLVELEFAQSLGFTAEEVEKARLEAGVVMVQEKVAD